MAQSYIRGRSAAEIAASIEAGIREGRLPPGGRLPTVRDLAGALAVSPTTVAAVYRALREGGLVVASGRLGTAVAPRPPVATWRKPVIPPGVRDLASGNPDPSLLAGLGAALQGLAGAPTSLYGEPADLPELVAAAHQQLRTDGMPEGPVTVVGGALDGLERVLQAHLRPGDRVAVEDPCYPGFLDLLGALRLVGRPVSVDDSGPLPEALEQVVAAGVEACVFTPRAQNPFGSAIDPARARALRHVLRSRGDVLVVEDDHAGAVAGAPPVSLCAGRERWALIRSVSKSLGPDLRVAVLTGDPTTVGRVQGRRLLGAGWVSHLLQRLVLALWDDPEILARLEAAASTYTRRRDAMLGALAARGIAAHGRSGLNVWVPVPQEEGVTTGLARAGWAVASGERFRIASGRGIRVTVASLEGADAERLASDLAAILRPEPVRLA